MKLSFSKVTGSTVWFLRHLVFLFVFFSHFHKPVKGLAGGGKHKAKHAALFKVWRVCCLGEKS